MDFINSTHSNVNSITSIKIKEKLNDQSFHYAEQPNSPRHLIEYERLRKSNNHFKSKLDDFTIYYTPINRNLNLNDFNTYLKRTKTVDIADHKDGKNLIYSNSGIIKLISNEKLEELQKLWKLHGIRNEKSYKKENTIINDDLKNVNEKNEEEIKEIKLNKFIKRRELLLTDKIKEICKKGRETKSTPRKLENLRDVVEIDQILKKTEKYFLSS